MGQVRAPSLHRHYPVSAVLRTHPPSAFAGAGPRGFAVGTKLPLLTTIADFPCCALLMSRACCHHYPGGISGCVSRSLRRRRRPSPLLWRVGSHIDYFEACSMFTHVAARTVRCPPIGVFSRSASGHSSPPDPPRVLPAGARVAGLGFHQGEQCTLSRHTHEHSRARHSSDNNRGAILPISAKKWRSITAGTRCMAARSGSSTPSSDLEERLSSLRLNRVWRSCLPPGCLILPFARRCRLALRRSTLLA